MNAFPFQSGMNAFPIRAKEDIPKAIALIDALWDAIPGTTEHDTLHVMCQLVDAWQASPGFACAEVECPRADMDRVRAL